MKILAFCSASVCGARSIANAAAVPAFTIRQCGELLQGRSIPGPGFVATQSAVNSLFRVFVLGLLPKSPPGVYQKDRE